MADRPPQPESREHAGGEPRTPRWVKVFGIVAIVLVLLVGFILISGVGGPHGPSRHAQSGHESGHYEAGMHGQITVS